MGFMAVMSLQDPLKIQEQTFLNARLSITLSNYALISDSFIVILLRVTDKKVIITATKTQCQAHNGCKVCGRKEGREGEREGGREGRRKER
jgi:hypothetical protein